MQVDGINSDKLWLVGRKNFHLIWDEVEAILLELGSTLFEIYSLNEIKLEIQKGKLDLWVIVDKGKVVCVGLAFLSQHANRCDYHVLWLSGYNFKLYEKEALAKLELYALTVANATYLIVVGRKGWKPRLEKLGFTEKYIQMRKNVREKRGH